MTIPIFNYRLTVIIYDSWKEVEDIFEAPREPLGITKYSHGKAIVGINSKHQLSVVHEAEHVKNLIWDYIGYTPNEDNDEVDAYLITYIYERIMDVLNKHR